MRTVLYCKHSKGSRPLFVKIKCNIAGLLSTGTPPHLLAAQDPARLLPRTVNGTGLMALGTQMLGGLPAKISCWSVHWSLRYDFSSVFLITGPRAVPGVFFIYSTGSREVPVIYTVFIPFFSSYFWGGLWGGDMLLCFFVGRGEGEKIPRVYVQQNFLVNA